MEIRPQAAARAGRLGGRPRRLDVPRRRRHDAEPLHDLEVRHPLRRNHDRVQKGALMPLNARIAEWKDRRVWLVGASTGIGAALAHALLARGARVAVSARSAGRLRSLVAGRGDALVLPLDVTRPEDFGAAHARILNAWGAVDLAVYLAGTYQPTRAWELTVERARTHVEANLMGAFSLLPVVLPEMLARGAGGVALVSSVAGYRGL